MLIKCQICNKEITRTGSNQKYCLDCAKVIHNEQRKEEKRKWNNSHKEEKRKWNKLHYDRLSHNESQKRFRKLNPDYSKNWQKSHQEKYRVYHLKWRFSNSDKVRMELYARRHLRKYKINDFCELCGIKGVRLVMHHTEYTQRNKHECDEEDAKKIILVCDSCHRKIHNDLKKEVISMVSEESNENENELSESDETDTQEDVEETEESFFNDEETVE